MSKKPDFEAFAKDVMKEWPELGDIEFVELFEMANKHGLLVEIEGGFNPEIHEDEEGGADPGDPWYELNFKRS